MSNVSPLVEKAIDEVYLPHKRSVADQAAKQEQAEKDRLQKQEDEFRSKLDELIPREIQDEMAVAISQDGGWMVAEFVYRGEIIVVRSCPQDGGNYWELSNDYVIFDSYEPERLYNAFLIKLGEFRDRRITRA